MRLQIIVKEIHTSTSDFTAYHDKIADKKFIYFKLVQFKQKQITHICDQITYKHPLSEIFEGNCNKNMQKLK